MSPGRLRDPSLAHPPALAAPLLSVRGVRKAFGDHVVLDGLSLDVHAHQVVVLLGAPGSGRSTLLRCIALLEGVDGGAIELEGQDITADAVRTRIALVSEAPDERRAAIARALGGTPAILLLDEATGDDLPLLAELRQTGLTMLVATDDLTFVREVADEVGVLHEGRVQERGRPTQVLDRPRRDATRALLRRITG